MFIQKPSSTGVLRRCSEIMHQIYWRALAPKCDFNKFNFTEITLWHGCSLVNLLHIFRIL